MQIRCWSRCPCIVHACMIGHMQSRDLSPLELVLLLYIIIPSHTHPCMSRYSCCRTRVVLPSSQYLWKHYDNSLKNFYYTCRYRPCNSVCVLLIVHAYCSVVWGTDLLNSGILYCYDMNTLHIENWQWTSVPSLGSVDTTYWSVLRTYTKFPQWPLSLFLPWTTSVGIY